jgi:hypothetical protein
MPPLHAGYRAVASLNPAQIPVRSQGRRRSQKPYDEMIQVQDPPGGAKKQMMLLPGVSHR